MEGRQTNYGRTGNRRRYIGRVEQGADHALETPGLLHVSLPLILWKVYLRRYLQA